MPFLGLPTLVENGLRLPYNPERFQRPTGRLSRVRIALAQINTTVGDVEGNARRAADAIEQCRRKGAELVLLPELTLSGYPPQDLLERRAFLEANEQAVRQMARAA